MLYKNLRAEMVRANYSVASLAAEIKVTEKTLRNKLNGETDFTWPEALAIRCLVNPKMKMEEMFQKEQDEPQQGKEVV